MHGCFVSCGLIYEKWTKKQNKTSNKGLTIILFCYVLISSLQNATFGACAKDEHKSSKCSLWLASHLEMPKSLVPIVHYYKNKKTHGATDRVHSLSKEWHHGMSCITNNEHLIWEVVRFTLWIKAEYSMVQTREGK